jgi:hypothetical protein
MTVFSDFSLIWLIPWGFLALGLSYLFYRNQKNIQGVGKVVRISLVGLRGVALFLLGMLLWGILIESSVSRLEKPIMLLLVDNSSSMLNYKDSSEVEKRISKLENDLISRYGDKFDLKRYSVDASVRTNQPDYKGQSSNLDAGFRYIYEQYYNRNIAGVCFVSDGNFNQGNSPQYTAEKIPLTPVFTIGVGDTVLKRDHYIRSVTANDIAFFKNKFPIEVAIEANKMKAGGYKVRLFQDGVEIAEEQLNYKGETVEFHNMQFIVDANTIGFTNYTVSLEEVDSESSLENNKKSVFVEVIDSRSKILMVSEFPHPDVTAIKQVLDKNPNAEVESILLSEWKGDLKDVELLIWQGAGVNTNTALVNEIRSSGVPTWYLMPINSVSNSVNALGIGLKLPNDRRTDDVHGYVNTGFQFFEVSEAVDKMLEKAPPVQVKYGTPKTEGGVPLISQRIGPVKKQEPILLFGKTVRSKYAAFLGEGLWRWRLAEFSRTKEHKGFEELVQKTVQYLVVQKNTEPFRINLPRRFTINDPVTIQAEFYNEAFEPIVAPNISLQLTNELGKTIPYTFAKNSTDYTLGIGKLESGKYSWEASTTFNGKKYTKKGVFVVEEISLETLATRANHNLLQLLSDQSSGQFYQLNNVGQMLADLDERNDIVTVSYEEIDYNNLIDWKLIFALIAFLMTLEWFLRRYFGTY